MKTVATRYGYSALVVAVALGAAVAVGSRPTTTLGSVGTSIAPVAVYTPEIAPVIAPVAVPTVKAAVSARYALCASTWVDGATPLLWVGGSTDAYRRASLSRTPASGTCDTIRIFFNDWSPPISNCYQARVKTFNNDGSLRVTDTWRSGCARNTVTLRTNVDAGRLYVIEIRVPTPWYRTTTHRPNFRFFVEDL